MTQAIAAGPAHKAVIQAHLNALDDRLDAAGVRHFSARELTLMRKAPGNYAIPPLSLWDNLVRVCVELAEPLRAAYGGPLIVLGGYRPTDYNRAVGGAPGSRHLYAQAIDITCGNVPKLRSLLVNMFKARASEPIGIGLYRGNVHVDYGYRRRFWGSQAKASGL